MDEPLASLDEAAAPDLSLYRAAARRMRVPIVYVSHSVARSRGWRRRWSCSRKARSRRSATAQIMGRSICSADRTRRGWRDSPNTGRRRSAVRADAAGPPPASSACPIDLPVGAALRVRIRARDVIALAPPEVRALNVPGRLPRSPAATGRSCNAPRLRRRGAVASARRSVETLVLRRAGCGHQKHRVRSPCVRRHPSDSAGADAVRPTVRARPGTPQRADMRGPARSAAFSIAR